MGISVGWRDGTKILLRELAVVQTGLSIHESRTLNTELEYDSRSTLRSPTVEEGNLVAGQRCVRCATSCLGQPSWLPRRRLEQRAHQVWSPGIELCCGGDGYPARDRAKSSSDRLEHWGRVARQPLCQPPYCRRTAWDRSPLKPEGSQDRGRESRIGT